MTLTPRVPRNITKDECHTTPRVCFAPSVEQCVIGIVGHALSSDITFLGAFYDLANAQWCPTVYWTDEALFEPEWVSDFHITHEEWALEPIRVERLGYIDCLAMVRQRRIVIVDQPVYVDEVDHKLISNINEEESGILFRLLQPQE